jgi:hypothetical protein
MLQGEVGLHSFELPMLVRQLCEPFHTGGVQSPLHDVPFVIRGGAEAVVPPAFIDETARIGLVQDGHDLRFGTLRLVHGTPPGYGGDGARTCSV